MKAQPPVHPGSVHFGKPTGASPPESPRWDQVRANLPKFRDAFQAAQDAWMYVEGELSRQELEAFLREQTDPETGEPFASREEILRLLSPQPAKELVRPGSLQPDDRLCPEERSPPVAKWQGPSREIQRNQPVIVAKAPPPNPPARDWNHCQHQSDEPGFSLLPWFSNYWLGVPAPKSFDSWCPEYTEAYNQFKVVLCGEPDMHKRAESRAELYKNFATLCGNYGYTLESPELEENEAAQAFLHKWLQIARSAAEDGRWEESFPYLLYTQAPMEDPTNWHSPMSVDI